MNRFDFIAVLTTLALFVLLVALATTPEGHALTGKAWAYIVDYVGTSHTSTPVHCALGVRG